MQILTKTKLCRNYASTYTVVKARLPQPVDYKTTPSLQRFRDSSASMSSCQAKWIGDRSDLSDLYFSKQDALNGCQSNAPKQGHFFFVGPIRVDLHHDVGKGRCLRAERDIEIGELLFATPSLISAPVNEVYNEWKQQSSSRSVAEAAEIVLVRRCGAACAEDPGVRNALHALEYESTSTTASIPSIDQLLGKDFSATHPGIASVEFGKHKLLQIIRRDAFGADFITDAVVERKWKMHDKNDDNSTSFYQPPRLLGHYPLAAMLNHSCLPNAVRVFCHDGEVMVVHACQRIAKGEEIVWSYIPLMQSVQERRQRLQETHGFVCHCERCEVEAAAVESRQRRNSDVGDNEIVARSVEELECLLSGRSTRKNDGVASNDDSKQLSNAAQRYLRVSHLTLYLDYLNGEASCPDRFPDLLELCTQLHFALASCHNASTEHLSVRRIFPSTTSQNDI